MNTGKEGGDGGREKDNVLQYVYMSVLSGVGEVQVREGGCGERRFGRVGAPKMNETSFCMKSA